MPSVVVVGGGVIGLTSALAVQEKFPNVDVTIISSELSPNTTADGSAGLWEPYLLSDTPEEDIRRWSGATYKFFKDLWRSPDGGEIGLSLIPAWNFSQEPQTEPLWLDLVLGYNKMKQQRLVELGLPNCWPGEEFVTFTCEPVQFLPYLMKIFKNKGGIMKIGHVSSLESLSKEYDVIVNCCGIGAYHLVGDKSVHPLRGQVMRVKAPWLFHVILDGSDIGNYMIPNQETVVLGGTHQKNDWTTEPYPEDTKFIREGCTKLVPGLKHAEFVKEWVGLRPGRFRVRLEREKLTGEGGSVKDVVHNYGHGGSGVTLCWGCAKDAANLVEECLKEAQSTDKTLKAKL